VVIEGCGPRSILKKVGNSDAPVLITQGSPSLTRLSTNDNPESVGFTLRDFQIDGSWKDLDKQIIAGAFLSMSASTVRNLFIKNVYGAGLVTSGGNTAPMYGMESTIDHIRIELCGKDGWDVAGPHDSTVDNFIIIDSGQLQNNTYYGIHSYSTMNMRGNALHVWHRSTSLRNKYAFFAESWGDDIANSHFEGAEEAQLVITGQNCEYSNCKAYANWSSTDGFSNVIIRGTNNRFIGSVGGPGEPGGKCIGVKLGDGTAGEYAANCYVNVTCINTVLGGVDFTHESGHNMVFLTGFTSGLGYAGTPETKGTSFLLSTLPDDNVLYWAGDKRPAGAWGG
jgi:hypothetical protein